MAKLSDKEFLQVLRESAGLFFRAVKLIKKNYKVDISRQAVHHRAKKFKKELEDIREQNKDFAEEVIHTTMRSKNETLAYKAAIDYMKTIGKDRGYVDRQEISTEIIIPELSLNLRSKEAVKAAKKLLD